MHHSFLRLAHLRFAFTAVLLALGSMAGASEGPPTRSPSGPISDDTWWTGPLLAFSAASLPEHSVVLETYAFESVTRSRFDESGRRQATDRSEYRGSLAELFYGVTPDLTVAGIGRLGIARDSQDPHPGRIGVGDVTLQAQYQLTRQGERGAPVTLALVLAETLPTGRYDNLGDHPIDGLGTGAHTTTIALYSQRSWRVPTGRPFRTQLNLSYSTSDAVRLRGASVYATSTGFEGHARPGKVVEVDFAAEYSFNRHWAAAIDLDYNRGATTRVHGLSSSAPTPRVEYTLGATSSLTLAPALEFNWRANLGVIAGVLIPLSGRNVTASATPTLAITLSFD